MNLRDVFVFVGLGVMGVGIGMLSVPWALIVVGGAMAALGLAGARAPGASPPPQKKDQTW